MSAEHHSSRHSIPPRGFTAPGFFLAKKSNICSHGSAKRIFPQAAAQEHMFAGICEAKWRPSSYVKQKTFTGAAPAQLLSVPQLLDAAPSSYIAAPLEAGTLGRPRMGCKGLRLYTGLSETLADLYKNFTYRSGILCIAPILQQNP